MYSRHHLVLSVATAGVVVPVLDTQIAWPWLVGWAAVVGTLVDLDHFLVARLRTGSWAALGRCLASPRVALLDQGEIFRPGEVGAMERLLTHLILTGGVVGVLLVWRPPVAVLTAVVLYVHLLSDVAWELVTAGEG